MRLSYVNNLLIVCTGISPAANIFRLATASRAGVALRRKCEPIFVAQAPRVGSRAERGSKKRTGALRAPVKVREFRLRRIFLLAALVSELSSPCSQNANPYSWRRRHELVLARSASAKKEQEHCVLLFFFW